MSSANPQYTALRELNTSRCYTIVGIVFVHIAAYGLFANVLPELSAVLGIAGLGIYRSGNRQMVAARRLLLDSINTNRLVA